MSRATETNQFLGLSLEQLLEVNVDKVYGASRYEQRVVEAPASVALIPREDFQRFGYRTLAAALRGVNGLDVVDDRNYSHLNWRGFNRPGDYNSRVLLLVDGHRLNDNVFHQALYGHDAFLEVDLIERVEVIRGPSSSIYGDNAFFGVVNVVPRRAGDLNGLETSGAVGGPEAWQGRVTFGREFPSGWDVLVSASAVDAQGDRRIYFPEFDGVNGSDGVARHADGEQAAQFYAAVSHGDFSLNGGWAGRSKDVPTASYETLFNDGGEQTEDHRAWVGLKWAHEFSSDLNVQARLAYDYAEYCGEYPYDRGAGRVLNLDEATGEWVSLDWQLDWRAQAWLRLLAGGDWRDSFTLEQRNFDAAPAQVYLDDSRSEQNFGGFVQAEISVRTNWLLNLGVRGDHYSSFGETLNPRLGLIYQPAPATTLKALYGEAFRAPNAYEMYYAYPGQAKANLQLQPETIRTYELGWEQGWRSRWRSSVAAYYYEVADVITQTLDPGDGLAFFDNLDAAQAFGVELGLEHRGAGGSLVRLSYARQQAEDRDTGAWLSNSPKHLAKLALSVPLWRQEVFAGVECQYASAVRTLVGGRGAEMFFVNATLSRQRAGSPWEASASVYNLFDERDGYAGSREHQQELLPAPGRAVRFKLTYKF